MKPPSPIFLSLSILSRQKQPILPRPKATERKEREEERNREEEEEEEEKKRENPKLLPKFHQPSPFGDAPAINPCPPPPFTELVILSE